MIVSENLISLSDPKWYLSPPDMCIRDRGMCGKSYMLLTCEVSAVEASIERAKELVAEKGMYMDSSVIAHPDKRMIDTIL